MEGVMNSEQNFVTYSLENDVALIGLNRTDKHNALSRALQAQLKAAAIRAGEEARVAVLFSHGKNFCAGLDLREASTWMTNQMERFRHRMVRNSRPFEDIARAPIPFVAAISGACIGGGLELASACHLRVAEESAFFALPEGQRGIYIGGGGSVRIARLLGVGRMTDLMLTGRVLTASEGERFGIVQYLVSAGQALERSKSLADRIAENAPMTNWAVISGLPRIQDVGHEDGLFVEGLLAGVASTPESGERLRAFLEKRAKPLGQPGTSGDGRAA
jgi:enoyl-CoA hydratase/carnithine racemase